LLHCLGADAKLLRAKGGPLRQKIRTGYYLEVGVLLKVRLVFITDVTATDVGVANRVLG
jgi:hypothetical protein